MSTEIKNTLFRFVTMRAPELLENDAVNQNFVKHPEADKDSLETFTSQFLNAAIHIPTGLTKKKTLENVVSAFKTNAFEKKEDLYLDGGLVSKKFYDFAIWLTTNRAKLTAKEIQEKISDLNFILTNELERSVGINNSQLNNNQLNILWENLFYQIITFKSGYVREAVLSMLVADFVLKNYQNEEQTEEFFRKLAQARVIIPKVIFEKEDITVQKTQMKEALEALPVNTKTLDKEMDLFMLKEEIESMKMSVYELTKAQTVYNKKSQKAFDLAKKKHNTQVVDLYAKAETTTRTVKDPLTSVERTVTEYVNLEIPTFEFEKEPELQPALLTSKTSQKTISFVDQLVDTNDFETFDEVINSLNQQIEVATQTIFDNSVLTQTMVSTNGMVFPVSNTINGSVFTIGATSLTGTTPLTFLFNDSVNNADIVSANYTLTFDDNTVVTQTSFTDTIVNGKLSVKTFLTPLSLLEKNSFTIEGVFTLSDGQTINFSGGGSIAKTTSAIGISLAKPVDGLSKYTVRGNGKYTLKSIVVIGGGNGDTSGTGSSTTSATDGSVITYIPSGFGVKRLGIADYRKVEQEICCYVPGEVSHIENIMAREYKEKSTRRLRRSEDTTTTSKETEREKLTDSTSTDRFEMNQEVASVLAESTSFGAHANASYENKTAGVRLDAGADFATNTSSEESNNQAVTHAKEVTERVLDRVVQKTKEERISKIIEEFEENNKHGFDNTKGDKHVSGVYRWVDKIYRNKVLNYGKRLMYEFMIPEPATFHNLAVSAKKDEFGIEKLEKPIDPRESKISSIKTYSDISWLTASIWASNLNAVINPEPEKIIKTSFSFQKDNFGVTGTGFYNVLGSSFATDLKLPENYQAIQVIGTLNAMRGAASGRIYPSTKISICNIDSPFTDFHWQNAIHPININQSLNKIKEKISVSVSNWDISAINGSLEVTCEVTPEAYKQWQMDTFNEIIKAYELKLNEYNAKLEQLKVMQTEKIRTNPMFYRQIENTVLRKNCIEYLASHNALGEKSLLLPTGTSVAPTVLTTQVDYENPALETYAAKVKFFEQAFEWGLMSYNFYPFYWADKNNWATLYNTTETDDPIFRAFLQSGMARVIVTARPGFEEAVNWYMATGQIWNGGQVPTMDDPLFISIVEELRQPEGEVEETWETRVPTSLTVIQAGSIGLNVEGLPCDDDCKDFKLFDSDGQPVLDANGKPISTNPITRSVDANGKDVVLGNTESTDTTGETGGGSGGPGQEPLPDPVV